MLKAGKALEDVEDFGRYKIRRCFETLVAAKINVMRDINSNYSLNIAGQCRFFSGANHETAIDSKLANKET